MPGVRTVFILDHSAPARLQSSLASDEDDRELGLEPCSIWSSCGHAALHYARMTLDLTASVPRSQISLHIAPGMRSSASDILNGWATKEQSLHHISSQLQTINTQDEKDGLDPATTSAPTIDPSQWIENAILGAMAHILEPLAATTSQPSQSERQQPSSSTSGTIAPQVFQDTHGASLAIPASFLSPVSKIKGHIVLILFDKNQSDDKAVTTATNVDNTSSDWMIDARDVKAILHGCFDSLYDALRASKVANIHVDIVRVSADANDKRNDILNYNHSKLYSASLFNVVAADESSITQAVSALFLRRNQNIEVLRIKGWPTEDKDREDNLIELFCQSDHLRAVQGSVAAPQSQHASDRALQTNESQALTLEYGSRVNGVCALPTQCAHPLTVSPNMFVSSLFSAGSDGACHLLKRTSSEEATHALYNHGGQVLLHCLDTGTERLRFEEAASTLKESGLASSGSAIRLDDFIDAVIRPNTILSDTLSFPDESNTFSQVHPPALPQHVQQLFHKNNLAQAPGAAFSPSPTATPNAINDDTEASLSTSSVNMSLVHTTTFMDLETRWLCQWEGGRPYTLTSFQETLVSKVRKVMCASQVDPEGLQIVESALDTLVSDARHFGQQQQQAFDLASGGPPPPPPGGKGNRRNNNNKFGPGINTAQWLLADLWMIGQRFKDVSKGHGDVAKLMSTKITPKGVDHAVVKQTLIPPQRRRQMAQQQQQMGQTPPLHGQPSTPQQQGGPRFQHGPRGGGMSGRGGRGGFRGGMQNQGNNAGNNSSPSNQGGGGGGGGGDDGGDDGVINDVMLSLSGKTQPVPYLITDPPSRETIDDAELEYQTQMGEEGSLLQAYWGGRGAQRNNVVNSHNPHQATTSTATIITPTSTLAMELEGTGSGSDGLLDSNALSVTLLPNMVSRLPPAPPNSLLGQYQQVYQKQQYLLARRQIKRPRLQDFAGRTPVAENGGFNGMI